MLIVGWFLVKTGEQQAAQEDTVAGHARVSSQRL